MVEILALGVGILVVAVFERMDSSSKISLLFVEFGLGTVSEEFPTLCFPAVTGLESKCNID